MHTRPIVLLFAAVLSSSYVHSESQSNSSTKARAMQSEKHNSDDLIQAIQRLRNRDIAAAKAKDFNTLASLFTENAVLMPPGGPALKSRAERDIYLTKSQSEMADYEILDYREDFDSLSICGDEATEWGTIHGTVRHIVTGKVESSAMKVVRILKRQKDGEWKIALSIFNEGVTPTTQAQSAP